MAETKPVKTAYEQIGEWVDYDARAEVTVKVHTLCSLIDRSVLSTDQKQEIVEEAIEQLKSAREGA